MGERIRAHDWASTPLGPVEAWPQSLRTAVDLILPSDFAAVILWGPDLVQIYNDGYCLIMAEKHPAGLGQRTQECWPEVWHINKPIYERVWQGETLTFKDALYPITRHGSLEDAWFDLCYSPMRDEAGDIAGILVTVVEVTGKRLAEKAREGVDTALRESEERLAADLLGMRRLYDLHARLAGETDLHIALDEIIDAANEFLGTDRGCVQLVSDDGERLEMFAYRGYAEQDRFVQHFLHQGSEAACDAARRDRRRLIIEDVEAFPDLQGTADREVALAEGIRATLHTPLSGRSGELLGVLSNQFRASHRPSDEQLKLVDLLAWTAADFIDQHQAGKTRRESEERQAILLKLSDALRPLSDAEEIRLTAATVLGEYLGANRVAYAENVPEEGAFNVTRNYVDGVSEVVGHRKYADYGPDILSDLQAGNIRVQPDIRNDPRLDDAQKQELAEVGVGASLNVPLVKQGHLVAFLGVNFAVAHDFTPQEIGLVVDVAERTWAAVERARAQAALRTSEEQRRVALEGGGMGAWRWDVASGLVWGDAALVSMWGLLPSAVPLHFDTFTDRISDQGREGLTAAVAKAVEAGGGFEGDLEVTAGPTRGHWVRWRGRVDPRQPTLAYGVSFDVTERRAAEAALRESKERQAFLLTLSDALLPLEDAVAIEGEACRLLGERLKVDRAYYGELDEAEGVARIRKDYLRGASPSVAGVLPLKDFGWIVPPLRRGETVVLEDAETSGDLPDADRPWMEAARIRACIVVPLTKEGQLRGALAVTEVAPRVWTKDEIALVRETGERIWAAVERARVEAALRTSEERYRRLFESIDEGFLLVDVVFDEKGKAVDITYVEANPAAHSLTGKSELVGLRMSDIEPGFDPAWAEVYGQVASSGQPVRMEFFAPQQVASGEGHVDRWFDFHMSRVGGADSSRVAVVFQNITYRKRAEAVLRESEERQAFLLEFSDALRPLADPVAVQGVACRIAGEHLNADRTYYGQIDLAREVFLVEHDYVRGGAPSLAGEYAFAEFGLPLDILQAGDPIVVDDVATSPLIRDSNRAAFEAIALRSFLVVPLNKHGELAAGLAATSTTPRNWTTEEASLLTAVAERTWDAVERAKAEAALRQGEERLRVLVESLPGGAAFIVDHEMRYLLAEGEALKPAGFVPEDFVGRTVFEALPEEIAREYEPNYRDVLAGRRFEMEHDAHGRTYVSRGTPPRYHGDKVEAALIVSYDITERRQAEEALRESEERFRRFGEASSDVLWIRNAETLQWEYLTPAFETIYGEKRETALTGNDLRGWAEMILPEDRERALANIRRVREGERAIFEYRIRRPSDGEVRWLRNTDFPILDAAGRVVRIGGIGQDVTEEKRTANRLQVLVAELQHRTRNLISVVRSLSERTLAGSSSLPDFRERFRERLAALSRVNSMLSRLDEGRKISFDEVLRSELEAHGAIDETGHGQRVTLEGPAGIQLRSATVQTFALALHELATNAVKYGALANDDGHLAVRWRVEGDGGGEAQLRVDWEESGIRDMAAAGAAPRGGGYGRELIEKALPYQLNAKTSFEVGPEGVRCRIVLPLRG